MASESPPLKRVNVAGRRGWISTKTTSPSIQLPSSQLSSIRTVSIPPVVYVHCACVCALPRLFVSINDQQDVPKGIIKLPNEGTLSRVVLSTEQLRESQQYLHNPRRICKDVQIQTSGDRVTLGRGKERGGGSVAIQDHPGWIRVTKLTRNYDRVFNYKFEFASTEFAVSFKRGVIGAERERGPPFSTRLNRRRVDDDSSSVL